MGYIRASLTHPTNIVIVKIKRALVALFLCLGFSICRSRTLCAKSKALIYLWSFVVS